MEPQMFNSIRNKYSRRMARWIQEYEETGNMIHDPYLLDWDFTPIEWSVWQDIRGFGLPFFPQLPVLRYFVDFGCPFLKIAIECDGKRWHDAESDRKRDERLAAAGWSVFRIPSHECNRVLGVPWEIDPDMDSDDIDHRVECWFMETSEGLIYSLKQIHFNDAATGFAEKHMHLIRATLAKHNTTPSVRIQRPLRVIERNEPIHVSVGLDALVSKMRKESRT